VRLLWFNKNHKFEEKGTGTFFKGILPQDFFLIKRASNISASIPDRFPLILTFLETAKLNDISDKKPQTVNIKTACCPSSPCL
jgi:hypothetical protein